MTTNVFGAGGRLKGAMAGIRFGFVGAVLLSLLAAGCATGPSAEDVATAKRFVHVTGMGGVAMVGFQRAMEEQSKTRPAVGELMRRVFADLRQEDVEEAVAPAFAKHLSHEDLVVLTDFAESEAGQKVFKFTFAKVLKGEDPKNDELMRQLSADDLTRLAKFGQSSSATAFNKAMPAIQKDMQEAARQLGERKMKEYLNRNKS